MIKLLLPTGLLLLFIAVQAQDDKKNPEQPLPLRRLPDVILTDINGKSINVADYGKNGKIMVFSFWATWCAPCKKELTNMNDLYKDWQKKYNVELVAVSIDDAKTTAKVKSYIDGQTWNYNVLLDVNQNLKNEMKINGVPYTVILDPTGQVIFSHSGYIDGDEYFIEEQLQKMKK